jgi:hypothetical protein
VKHSFGKNESTFKNRCRFMCQCCWDTGNSQKERRYSGKPGGAERYSHKLAGEARKFCTCTSKDGWVCNECKEEQNEDARKNGSSVCFGKDCDMTLEDDKDRRKICIWCDKPVPRGRASMESRIAFDQKMMGAREREMSSQLADFQEYENNRRRQMRMSRREMRGDDAVKDDPEADIEQFVRNLDLFNYRRLVMGDPPTGDEIYWSKHGRWKYNYGFVTSFRRRCWMHKDASYLKWITSYDTPDNSQLKTNHDVMVMQDRRALDELHELRELEERSKVDDLAEGFYDADSTASPGSTEAEMEDLDRAQEQKSDAEADGREGQVSTKIGNDRETDDETSMQLDDDIPEGGKGKGKEPTRDDGPSSEQRVDIVQPDERPPEYGSDTLVLETGDAMESG